MRALVFAAALVLAVSIAHAEQPDAFALQIDAGRLNMMTDSVRELAYAPERPAPAHDEDPSDPAAIARSLRISVLEHNALAAQLCAEGRFPALACQRAWLPSWLGEAPNARPSLATLQTRWRAASERIMPLWDAICSEARAKASEDERMAVCPME